MAQIQIFIDPLGPNVHQNDLPGISWAVNTFAPQVPALAAATEAVVKGTFHTSPSDAANHLTVKDNTGHVRYCHVYPNGTGVYWG